MMRRAGLVGVLVLGGCLFRAPEPARFFRPGSAMLDAVEPDGAGGRAAEGIPVRVQSVRSDVFLRERIVWRVSPVEYGVYEERRWTDLPVHYVERALRTRLRATPGLRLTDDARAVAVHVDVLAFDDTFAPTHAANVVLAVRAEDPSRGRLFERTVEARAEIADDDPATMATAMGKALDDAVTEAADAVRSSVVVHRRRGGR